MALALCASLLAPASLQATAALAGDDPKLEAAYQFALAKLLADEGAFQQAERAYREAIDLDGTDPYGHVEYAKFQSYLAQISRSRQGQKERLEEAAAVIAAAEKLAPDNLDVLRSYAQIHLQLGEYDPASLELAREAYEALRRRTEGDLQVLTSLGQLYLWQRQPEVAAEVLREAASFRPDHRMIYSMLVEALLGAGEPLEAEEILGRLIEIDPTTIDHYLRLVELLGQRGAHRDAVAILRAAPPELSDSSRLRHALARELHLIGDSEDALTLTDALIAEYPERTSLKRLRLAILGAMARYEEAIGELHGLIEGGDGGLQDELMLSRLQERVGRSDEAARGLEARLAETDSEDQLQVRLALAGVLERSDASDEAITLLAGAFAAASSEREVALYAQALGEIYQRTGRIDDAVEVLDRGARRLARMGMDEEAAELKFLVLATLAEAEEWTRLERRASTSSAADLEMQDTVVRLRAEALAGAGQVDEALALLGRPEHADNRLMLAKRAEILFRHDRADEALELLEPLLAGEDVTDLFFAAQVFQRGRRYGDMVPVLERLRDRQPGSIQTLFLLGMAYERLGRREAAIATFQDLLSRAPDHAPTLNYLGYMWAERKEELEQALVLIRRAVAIEPDNGAYVDSLGWAYFQLGRYDEARGHLEWAARLIPGDPTIHEHLGDLYVELDELERARDSYRQALEIGGDGLENLDEIRSKLEGLESEVPASRRQGS